jgi:hypothetical protein
MIPWLRDARGRKCGHGEYRNGIIDLPAIYQKLQCRI